MLKVSRILVPVLFTEACQTSLACATRIASRFGSEVTLLHVLEPLKPLEFDTTETLELIERYRRAWVARQFKDLIWGLPRGLPVTSVCAEGDPATEIVRLAERLSADLIIMATHGHGPIRRFLLGSVTAKVLHDVPCAVWTGAHLGRAVESAGKNGQVQRIVCSIDFGPQTEAALAWSSGLASACDASISLLHVLPPEHAGKPVHPDCTEARELLEAYRAKLGMEADCLIVRGDLVEEIASAVRQVNADLLVIGRGHPKGGGRLRSHSYAILRESICPVLSV